MFQSSPAPKSGRYRKTVTPWSRWLCFNPRPPRRAGATNRFRAYLDHWQWFQSSPAPKSGRYLIVVGNFHVVRVSILARPEERALLRLLLSKPQRFGVSILARPEERALRTWGTPLS